MAFRYRSFAFCMRFADHIEAMTWTDCVLVSARSSSVEKLEFLLSMPYKLGWANLVCCIRHGTRDVRVLFVPLFPTTALFALPLPLVVLVRTFTT